MRRRLGKYWAIFQTQLLNSLAYPLDLAGRSLSIVLFLWIFVQLWRATYRATGQQAIAGLTLRETLWYLMLAETVYLSKPRLAGTVAQAVREGSIAYQLNKPYSFLLYHLSAGLGDCVLRLGFGALMGGAVVWLSVGPPPDPRGWPLVLLAVAGAWLIDFCLEAMIGLAAFVMEDTVALEWIYQKVTFVLGGLLIPLDFYPRWLRSIAQALPFAYTVYGPARLFVQTGLGAFVALVARQGMWLAVGALCLAFLYGRGVARLTINGG